ncbi:MAG: SPOR domain-containing protein [candidate division WOR-3 bacterium]|nr:SPOR domain-containing protein [candidate division WOR-3 bacterium]
MKKLLLLGCILLFVVCAPKKTTVETEGLEEVVVFGEEEPATMSTEPVLPAEEPLLPPPPVEEEPMTPAEEELVLIPPPVAEEPILPERPVAQPYVPTQPVAQAPAPRSILGFRVQIFASNTEENASRVATDARAVFTDPVYIEYVAPYYKVRVGDYLTREEIEPLKNKALSFGYRGAFIVETMVTP